MVDDEPDLRLILRRLLERAGHEVVEAIHGRQALQSVGEARPDLVVTDLMMPVMDGDELIRRLRADPATADIPILAVTAFATQETAADVAVVLKPYRPEGLLRAVDELLAWRGERT